MKGDPERLLSAQSGADPLERELLGSVRRVDPPEGARDHAWRGIAGQIAAGVVVGATVSSSAATAKAGIGALVPQALASKVAVVLAAGGVAAGGYWAFHAMSEPAPSPPAPMTLAPPKTPPQAQALEPPRQPELGEPQEAPAKRNGEPKRVDLLQAESGLLTEARAQLRSGNAAGAQATLNRLESQFPKGVLGQEREVLAIEVLAARGNAQAARLRAQAFVRAYPKSPHSAKLSRFLDPP
jgi:hypothetical protein